MPAVLYLHGFLSSPNSSKAKSTRLWLAKHRPDWQYYCPQLSSYPTQARKQLVALYARFDEPPLVIGSSLGGFWAAWCIERYGGRAVLVNPAVSPHLRFQHYIGQPLKSFYSDDVYILSEQDLNCLEECDPLIQQRPDAYFVMLQSGDETLDYRLALARYSGSRVLLEQGGNHSFEGYTDHLSDIVDFLGR